MDSDTLNCCLKYLLSNTVVENFHVIARDQLNLFSFSKLPLALIVNCSNSNSRGSHWVAFYVYRFGIELVGDFFDSYNNSLSKYNIIPPLRILKSSKTVLQSPRSVVCGLYALFFIYI